MSDWKLYKINKIMNFYWDMSNMSYLQYLSLVSFNKFNPDWQINLYVPIERVVAKTWKSDEQKCDYIGKDYYELVKTLKYVNIIQIDFTDIGIDNSIPDVFKSDILRWYLLANQSGGWSDIDILYLRPLSELPFAGNMLTGTVEDTDMTVMYGIDPNTNMNYHLIGFYLSSGDNCVFNSLFINSKKSLNLSNYQSVGSTLFNTLYKNNNILKKLNNLSICNLPTKCIYPYLSHDISCIFNSADLAKIDKTVVGLHWYNGSKIAKIFNNTYIPRQTNITNVITYLIKQMEYYEL